MVYRWVNNYIAFHGSIYLVPLRGVVVHSGKVGHYRNGSLCYCFSLVEQHLYISSARKFNECQNHGLL